MRLTGAAYFDVEAFVLESHHECAREAPADGAFPGLEVVVQAQEARAYAVTEAEDVVEGWPVLVFLWHFGVVLDEGDISMAFVRGGGESHTWQ